MRKLAFDPERDIPNLSGKIILITGGTTGLGAVSAIALAKHTPSRIYIVGRNARAGESVIERARRVVAGGVDMVFLQCDLADLSSVRDVAEHILNSESRLDILMANAGICAVPPGRTKDGYEIQFGTNHMGHALLIRKLLPLLSQTASTYGDARIVSVTSVAFQAASGIPLDSIKTPQRSGVSDWTGVGKWMRYAESKLANLVYAQELARRYPKLLSVSVHPGVAATGMVSQMTVIDRMGTKALGLIEGGVLAPEQGALNQLWAATMPRDTIRNGAMYNPVGIERKGLGKAASDPELARSLWEWTDRELARWM